MKRYLNGFLFLALLTAGLGHAPVAQALVCNSNASGNWNANIWTGGCAVTGPVAGDTVTIQNTHTVTITASAAAATLTIDSGGTLNAGAFTLTLSGATSVAAGGALNITGTGTKTFTGDVTVAGTWNETAAAAVTFGGNLQNDATSWTASTGVHTFSGAGRTISGTTPVVIPNTTITGTYTNVNTLTVNTALAGAGTLTNGNGTIAAVLNIGGTSAITGLTANPANNTVNYTGGAAQTVKGTTYNVLDMSGAGLKTAGTPGVTAATLTVNSGAAFTVGAFTLDVNGTTSVGGTLSLTSNTGAKTLDGAVTVDSGGVLTLAASSPTFGSTVDITGTMSCTVNTGTKTYSGAVTVLNGGIVNLQACTATFNNTVTVNSGGALRFITGATGTKTFNGTVTIDNGGSLLPSQATTINFNGDVTNNGTWNETAAVVMGFAGNLTNNGTAWTASTGVHTFSGSGKNISGTLAVVIPRVTVTGTCTNVNTLTVNTALAGGGTLTNGNGTIAAVLDIGGTSAITGLTANPLNNTVNYTGGAAQTVKGTTYNALNMSGAGLKTAGTPGVTAATLTVNSGAAFAVPAFTLSVTGITTLAGRLSLTSNTGAKSFTGAVTVQNLGILDLQASSPTFDSTVTVQSGGVMRFATSPTGTKTFNGAVTIDNGGSLLAPQATTVNFNADVTNNGTWNETAAVVMGFAGHLTNDGTAWTAGNGVHTFSGTGKNISGTLAVVIPSVNVTGTYTNVNTLTVATTLAGPTPGATLTNGDGVAAAVLDIGANAANLTLANLNATPANNTVNYTGAAQTVKATTYNNLNLNGSGVKTLTGLTTINGNLSTGGTATATTAANTTIGGTLTVNSGTTFTVDGFSLDVTGITTVGGTMSFATSAAGTKTFNSAVTINNGGSLLASQATTVNFNADVTNNGTWNETAAVAMSFAGHLTNNGTAWTAGNGVHTFSGTGKNISGTLAVVIPSVNVTGTCTNINTLTVATALAGGGTLTNGNGVTTAVLNIAAVAANLTLANLNASSANNTVNYTLAGNQTIKVPTASYRDLGLSGSGTKTAGGALTVDGNLTIAGTAVFAGGTSLTHNFGGNWIVNTTIGSSPFTYTTSSIINFNTPGTPAATSFGGATTQITAFDAVNVNNTSGLTLNDNISAAGNLTVAANVTLTPAGTRLVSGTGTLTGSGTVKVTDTSGTLPNRSFNSQYTITNKSLTNLTVEYAGTTQQTLSALTYGHVKINNAIGVTLASGGGTTATVGGTLTLTAGTLAVAGNTLVLDGPTIAGTPTNLTTTNASNLTFGGNSSGVNVPSSVLQLNNLTISNSTASSAGITLNSSPTVNGTLSFTQGNLSAGANTVIIPAAGTVTRPGTGHVIGNLQKNVAVSAVPISRSFEIGDAAAYSPIQIDFTSVATAGNLVAKASSLEHPDVANSLIDSTQNVNRYWTLTNTGIVFSDYSATATYVASDIDSGADPVTFGIGKADACDGSLLNCTWTYPTVVGTPTTTSAQASGMTGFSHFVVGRRLRNFLVEAAGGGNIGTQDQDTSFSIRITGRDAAGNTVTSFTGTVQISSVGCSFSSGSGTTASFVNGVLTSHSVAISSAATCSITATRTGGTETGTSNSFLVRAAVTAFDACEVLSPTKCTPGAADFDRLFTKLASTAFSLDLVAIKSGGTLNTDFAATATVDLLANTTAQSVGANNCPASATATITVGSMIFAAGRQTIPLAANAFSSVAPNYSAYRDVRVRVTCNATNCPPSGLTWCSADNFAVRPQDFTVASSMTNTAQTGTPSAAAGSDFTLTATAVAGYTGTPAIDRTASKVVTHVGVTDFTTRLRDTAGGNTITFPAATIGTGVSTHTVQYHDAGNVEILANGIVDSTFTAVDDPVKDCVGGSSLNTDNDGNANNGEKFGCNIANQSNSSLFGRFYPGYYTMSGGSVTAACASGGFSYMGHAAMGLGFTISAMSQDNPGGATLKLSKYTSGYLTLATVSVLSENGTTATDLTGNLSPSLAYSSSNWSAGDYAVTGSSYAFARPASTPTGPYESFYIGAGVTDADGAVLNALDFKLGDPTCTVSCTHKLLSASPTKIRFGRLRLENAVGAETLDLRVPFRAEYWTGAGFATNTLDSCTTLAPSPAKKFVLYGHQGGITTANMVTPTGITDGNVSTTGTFTSGVGSLTLLKPSPAATSPGSVRVCLDLDSGAGGDTSCQAVSPASLTHLQGKWSGSNYDKDPNARSAFGLYGAQPRQFIFFRETY